MTAVVQPAVSPAVWCQHVLCRDIPRPAGHSVIFSMNVLSQSSPTGTPQLLGLFLSSASRASISGSDYGHSPRRMCYWAAREGVTAWTMGADVLTQGFPGLCPSRTSRIKRGVQHGDDHFCIVKEGH